MDEKKTMKNHEKKTRKMIKKFVWNIWNDQLQQKSDDLKSFFVFHAFHSNFKLIFKHVESDYLRFHCGRFQNFFETIVQLVNVSEFEHQRSGIFAENQRNGSAADAAKSKKRREILKIPEFAVFQFVATKSTISWFVSNDFGFHFG